MGLWEHIRVLGLTRAKAAPDPAGDVNAVLEELGCSPGEIDALRTSGVI